MDASKLMNKLLELERAIGIADAIQLRNLVMDAETALLEMQRSSLTALHAAARAEPAPHPEPHIASWQETASSIRRMPAAAETSDQVKLPFGIPSRMLA